MGGLRHGIGKRVGWKAMALAWSFGQMERGVGKCRFFRLATPNYLKMAAYAHIGLVSLRTVVNKSF